MGRADLRGARGSHSHPGAAHGSPQDLHYYELVLAAHGIWRTGALDGSNPGRHAGPDRSAWWGLWLWLLIYIHGRLGTTAFQIPQPAAGEKRGQNVHSGGTHRRHALAPRRSLRL